MSDQRYVQLRRGAERASDNGASSYRQDQQKHMERVDMISTKVQAALWVLGAGALAYYTKLFQVIVYSNEVARLWFNLGLVCFGISFGVMLYFIVWVPYVEDVHLEWEAYNPNALWLGQITGFFASVLLCAGLWPVYGLLSPAILGVVFFGSIMTSHFLPACPQRRYRP